MFYHDLRAWTVWGEGLLVLSESSPLVLRAFTWTGDGRKDIAEFYIINKGRGGQVGETNKYLLFWKVSSQTYIVSVLYKRPHLACHLPFYLRTPRGIVQLTGIHHIFTWKTVDGRNICFPLSFFQKSWWSWSLHKGRSKGKERWQQRNKDKSLATSTGMALSWWLSKDQFNRT